MTVRTGVLVLLGALAAGLVVGYYIGLTPTGEREVDMGPATAPEDMPPPVTPGEELFRKGGPPTPEAKANTDTTGTTGS